MWQDAWRRLKKNKAAMFSMYFLILLCVISLFTPMLPLQSPIWKDSRDRQFETPNLRPAYLGRQRGLNFEDNSFVAQLKTFDEQLAAKRQEYRGASPGEQEAILQEIETIRTAKDPFKDLWNKPGFITRGMLRMRAKIFGDWCIPSICGTNNLGSDVLSRVVWGSRVSLTVGIVATLVSLMIGVTYGAVAGLAGGWLDNAMMRVVDILYSVPFIFIVIFIITILNAEEIKSWMETHHIDKLVVFYILIGLFYWLTMSRVVRGQVISLKNEPFIDAARSLGASEWRILFRHLIPNVMGVVIVYLTLTIPAVMLFEAFLSFLGLGVDPPDVSWGLLVNEGIQVITPVKTYWWLVLFPGLTMTLTLFALNFLGDGLRDSLDPRLRNK